MHSNASPFVLPAKAGIYVRYGHRPSPVYKIFDFGTQAIASR
jgi:hypothetical protein